MIEKYLENKALQGNGQNISLLPGLSIHDKVCHRRKLFRLWGRGRQVLLVSMKLGIILLIQD